MDLNHIGIYCMTVAGQIVIGRQDPNGYLQAGSKEITEDALRTTAEWFLLNKKQVLGFEDEGYLMYTDDPEKAKQIQKLLMEDDKK